MNKYPELNDIVDWVVKNRRNGAFPYNNHIIYQLIIQAINEDVFAYILDEDGFLCGIGCGQKSSATRIVQIHDVLTTRKGAIKKLMQKYIEKYPDFKIVASCRGRARLISNPVKFERRLK